MSQCYSEKRISQPNRKNFNRTQPKAKRKTASVKGQQVNASRMNTNALIPFYHYTSEWGMEGIIDSGVIRNSSHDRNHAHFGEGAYGTSLSPEEGQHAIALNNWTRHGHFYITNGKVSHAIEVRVPRNKVKKVGPRHRDILVHLDGPLELAYYEWKAWTVPENCLDSPILLQSSGPTRRRPQTTVVRTESAPRTRTLSASQSVSSALPAARPYRPASASTSASQTSRATYTPSTHSVASTQYSRASVTSLPSPQPRATPSRSTYQPRNSYDYAADARRQENQSSCTIL